MVRLWCLATGLVGLVAALETRLRPISELQKRVEAAKTKNYARAVDAAPAYRAHNFSVPIDHFHNETKYEPHSNGKFPLRYWFDDTHYKPGGPVFLFESGEADASDRLPILQHGIIYELSAATGGLGVIIEHRYYGSSQPVDSLTTENYRFLTTDQAIADNVYFAQHIVFPGHEGENLTASKVPWITYGGSYSGAFVAFTRKLYPDVFWGAISSSGVTKAIWNYWEYFEPIRQYGPPECIETTQQLIHAMDNIALHQPAYVKQLQRVFGLGGITSYADFQETLANYGIYGWQGLNWDPAVGSPAFYEYCGNISSNKVLYPSTAHLKPSVQKLLTEGGYGNQLGNLTNRMLNWIGYANTTIVQSCQGETQDQCFSTQNATFYQQTGLENSVWKSWPYQYCTQWGFLQTGSGAPANELPLISRLVNLPYSATICRDAFNLTKPADVNAINAYGGYDISYNRLAIIDGEWDPWRPATPHAPEAQPWNRPNTIDQPFYLIPKSVHHWDENYVLKTTSTFPPKYIQDVENLEIKFVKAWLKEASECGKFT